MLSILKKTIGPKDKKRYLISSKVIKDTEMILRDYAGRIPPHEGLVYWAGRESGNLINVTAMIAPNTESGTFRVSTSCKDNCHVVNELGKLNLIEIAQVHSHPSCWVDHSDGDDMWAAFKFDGLLSLVVPYYCDEGMRPLKKCGIHRYENGEFVRLSTKYVKKHFQLINCTNSKFVDLRK